MYANYVVAISCTVVVMFSFFVLIPVLWLFFIGFVSLSSGILRRGFVVSCELRPILALGVLVFLRFCVTVFGVESNQGISICSVHGPLSLLSGYTCTLGSLGCE